MRTCILLLRGINVGGRTRLAMRDLVAVLEALGFDDVATCLQSGNAVFRAPARELAQARLPKLAGRIRAAIETAHDVAPDVLLLSLEGLEAVVAANPFAEAEAQPQSVHVYFLMDRAAAPDPAALESLRGARERFLLTAAALYLHAPDGIARSRLAARAERHVGVPLTGRNWRTVGKVRALARERTR